MSDSTRNRYQFSNASEANSTRFPFCFQYLGSVEVFESRGMPVCEEAMKVLRVNYFSFITIFVQLKLKVSLN